MKPKVSREIRRQFAEMDRPLRESRSEFEERLVRFSDGEMFVEIKENVRSTEVS